MSPFFNFFAILCAVLYGAALLCGQFPVAFGALFTFFGPSAHMMLGLSAGILTVSLHCLIFAIFTGSGKDTRLLVQDLSLNTEFVKRTKVFKRTVFPPALYAILFILITTSLGGAVSGGRSPAWLHWVHGLVAWLTYFYNLKTFLIEARGVKENASILAQVNRVAAEAIGASSQGGEVVVLGAEEEHEWGTHVFALGKFLCFLGFNVWLPYLYIRFIMAELRTPFLPFLALSLVCLAGGYYLRYQYRGYRPKRLSPY